MVFSRPTDGLYHSDTQVVFSRPTDGLYHWDTQVVFNRPTDRLYHWDTQVVFSRPTDGHVSLLATRYDQWGGMVCCGRRTRRSNELVFGSRRSASGSNIVPASML